MKWVIHKGKHRPAFWWLQLALWFNKKVMEKEVKFFFSTKYYLEGEDHADHNKLFGIGYFPGHHRESARFGWRYDQLGNRFILSAYCYVDGLRIMKDLCAVVANKPYIMRIEKYAGHYRFTVSDKVEKRTIGMYHIDYRHKKKLGFRLGLFFGGNQPAPVKLTIEIKKSHG
ncbi:MAG: hypothetical protein H7Y42_07725 [Chitinophagaceae bacterium]|nr:hypothetical protein [Chitinophagaceae bacterium]